MVRYWLPPAMWRGQTAFVLACGPSLDQATANRVKGKNVIAVNSASYLRAPWAQVLYFNDTQWFRERKSKVTAFEGKIVTSSRTAAQDRDIGHRVLRVCFERSVSFPPAGSGIVKEGRSSGHKAVALAVAFGASRVVLLGFDMRPVDGRWHFHDEYRKRDYAPVYSDLFVPSFSGWHAAARAFGVEIVNATPGSALSEFPFVSLDEVLTCDPS